VQGFDTFHNYFNKNPKRDIRPIRVKKGLWFNRRLGTYPVAFSLITMRLDFRKRVRIFEPPYHWKNIMTELNSSKPSRKINFARTLATLFQPQRIFMEVASETGSSWPTPMLTLSLSTLLSVIVSGYLTARAAMMGEFPFPPDWQYWTPEMQNNYMQAQQATQGPVFVYVMPLVSALVALWLGWLILSGLLHLGSTLLGGRGSMGSALNVVGWANMPFVFRDMLRVVFMLIAGHAIVSPGLSGFAGGAVFVSQILAHTDLFFLWSALLLVIGFGFSDGLSRSKSIAGVVIVLLILLLAQAGLGSLVSNIGGLATQGL